jgi:hypothetical protein
MKKYIMITLVIAIVAVAAPVFAASYGPGASNTTAIAGANFVPSTSVTVQATATATNYCVTSSHASSLGNAAGKQWGALNTDSTIKYLLPAPSPITACTDAKTLGGSGWLQ